MAGLERLKFQRYIDFHVTRPARERLRAPMKRPRPCAPFFFVLAVLSLDQLSLVVSLHRSSQRCTKIVRPSELNRDHLLLKLRGGHADSGYYELNPHYVPKRSQLHPSNPTLGELDRYERQSQYYPPQQQQQQAFYDDAFRIQRDKQEPPLDRLFRYVSTIHQISPTVSTLSLLCIAVFGMWQVPAYRKSNSILAKYFVCSRRNVLRRRIYSSVVLSAFSHVSIAHLAINLIAYTSFGPAVKQSLRGWPLWPLVIGASISGSLVYLVTNRYGGGCMGLSSVTLALLGLYARMHPKTEIGMAVFGILPVRVRAELALVGLLAWSAVATFALPNSRVAHSAHFGGLLFGILYFELWKRRVFLRCMRFRSVA